MRRDRNVAVIVPMANEEPTFEPFAEEVKRVLEHVDSAIHVYCVVDNASKDRTLELCRELSAVDERFTTVYEPANRNVVEAYLRGYREAFDRGHDFIIEMDAGLSHDPRAIPAFLRALEEGNECAFGSRFIRGGGIDDSNAKRYLLSRCGTFLTNLLLGTRLHDMTSGFQAFHRHVVREILEHPFLSKAHFFQTELRYLLRNRRAVEVPIRYRAPSPRVSFHAVGNAIAVLFHYFFRRLSFRPL